jgi:hypothetical protein
MGYEDDMQTEEILDNEQFLKMFPEAKKIFELVHRRSTNFGEFLKGLKIHDKLIVKSISIDVENQLCDVRWNI